MPGHERVRQRSDGVNLRELPRGVRLRREHHEIHVETLGRHDPVHDPTASSSIVSRT